MPTPNYNFTTIDGSQDIDLVNDINTPLNQIDSALKEVADSTGGNVPTNHASAETTYGIGSTTLYGHVKVSDSGTAAASTGTAASPKYVNDEIVKLNNAITEIESSIDGINSTISAIQGSLAKFTSGRTYNDIATNGFVYKTE